MSTICARATGKGTKCVFEKRKQEIISLLAVSEEISCHLLAWPTSQCHGALHALPTIGWKRGQTFIPAGNTGPFFQLAQQSTCRSADVMTHLFRHS